MAKYNNRDKGGTFYEAIGNILSLLAITMTTRAESSHMTLILRKITVGLGVT